MTFNLQKLWRRSIF